VIDGTHINCCPSVAEQQSVWNWKGGVTQNCLACCTFNLCFQYILSGWDGSAADASVYNDAHQTDLTVLARKFYLADAGFKACNLLLVPYRRVRYHLAEWGCAAVR
jgi:DDE superfamily endonuclease